MRNFLFCVIILFSFSCFAQSTVRYIDASTQTPVCGIYTYILKNENTFENCRGSNEDGYLSLRIAQADTSATYHFSVNYAKFLPIWQEIDLHRKDTITIELIRDDYYLENTEEIYAKGCDSRSFFNYEPREPRTLDDIPTAIAKKVVHYLKERVGEELFPNFTLVDGQIIELDELRAANPRYKNERTAYYLCFSYRNLDAGIGMYTSKVELDSAGNVLQDIGFPEIKDNSVQKHIVSLKAIKEKVRNRGFYQADTTQTDLIYYAKRNILVWKFSNTTFHRDHTVTTEELTYNAHNGNFIKARTTKGLWEE